MTLKDAFYIALLFCMGFLLFDATCSRKFLNKDYDQNGDKIELPKMEGTLKTTDIDHKPIEKPKDLVQTKNGKTQSGNIFVRTKLEREQYENDSLNRMIFEKQSCIIEGYDKANDSLKREILKLAVQANDVSKTLENDTVKIVFSGKVLGTMESMRIDWTFKPMTAFVKQYLVLGGLQIDSNPEFKKPIFSPTLFYMSPSKVLFFGGKAINSDQFSFGAARTIFNHSSKPKVIPKPN